MKLSITHDYSDKQGEALSWYVIGAYQTGASVSAITAMTGLQHHLVRNTIRQFRRTGIPTLGDNTLVTHLARPKKQEISHWNEDEYIDSCDDEEGNDDIEETTKGSKTKVREKLSGLVWKSRLIVKPPRPSPASAIGNVLLKSRKYQEKTIRYRQISQEHSRRQHRQGHQQVQDADLTKLNQHTDSNSSVNNIFRPPSPPHHTQEQCMSSPTHSASCTQACHRDELSSSVSASSTLGQPPSPLLSSSSGDESLTENETQPLPCSLSSLLLSPVPSSILPASSSSANVKHSISTLTDYYQARDAAKKEPQHRQRREKHSIWSKREDKLLLRHVLTHVGYWEGIDELFDGRRSVKECMERWDVLHHYLFKELDKNGPSHWSPRSLV